MIAIFYNFIKPIAFITTMQVGSSQTGAYLMADNVSYRFPNDSIDDCCFCKKNSIVEGGVAHPLFKLSKGFQSEILYLGMGGSFY